MPSSSLHIAVGSKNPVKIQASVDGIRDSLQLSKDSSTQIVAKGYDVSSDVPDQPIGDEQTKLGAQNRAFKAWNEFKHQNNGIEPQYSIGLEGGISSIDANKEIECFAWMVIYNGKQYGYSRTCTFQLPEAISSLVRNGMELGDADDAVFNTINAKQGSGTVGHLTNGVINRTEYYKPAVLLAMIPFLWPSLYSDS